MEVFFKNLTGEEVSIEKLVEDLTVLAQDVDRGLLRDRLDQLRSEPAAASGLRTHRGRRIEMRCEGRLLHLDDLLWRGDDRVATTMEITVEPGALTFLIPPDSAGTRTTG